MVISPRTCNAIIPEIGRILLQHLPGFFAPCGISNWSAHRSRCILKHWQLAPEIFRETIQPFASFRLSNECRQVKYWQTCRALRLCKWPIMCHSSSLELQFLTGERLHFLDCFFDVILTNNRIPLQRLLNCFGGMSLVTTNSRIAAGSRPQIARRCRSVQERGNNCGG